MRIHPAGHVKVLHLSEAVALLIESGAILRWAGKKGSGAVFIGGSIPNHSSTTEVPRGVAAR
ncbi:MAG: hypothetical protein ACE5JX_01445 [Acidobacteriota bacterium]